MSRLLTLLRRRGPYAPGNLTLPAITGDATLTCTTGTWSNSPTAYAHQWRRDGTPIDGATANEYTIVEADSFADITCDVTATNAGGSTTATSEAVQRVVYLVRDDFTDTLAAGSVDGTAATPGPGTRTVVDTGSHQSVAGGQLVWSGGVNGNLSPNIHYGDLAAQAAGRAMAVKLTLANVTQNVLFGFAASGATTLSNQNAIQFIDTAIQSYNLLTQIATNALPTDTTHAIVQRSVGALLLRKSAGTWQLLYVNSTESTGVRPIVTNFGQGTGSVDFVRVAQLPGPFDSDYGLATDRLAGARSAGDTFVHEADFIGEFTVTTLPSASSIRWRFRQQGGADYWDVALSAGGQFNLWEVVGGTPTVRGATTDGAVANGHRIVIVCEGSTIRGYSNNVLRWTYSSATNFATATAGSLSSLGTGGAVSDIVTWPRTITGSTAAILNTVSA